VIFLFENSSLKIKKRKRKEGVKMIDLIWGLHLYQPPNQKQTILERITEESYLPTIDAIISHQNKAVFTVDIARSTIEGLEQFKRGQEFLEKLKKALELNNIVLVNTAAYHPILPLIPEEEISRQGELNEAKYKLLLQEFYQKPQGFFPPEMAFAPTIIPIIKTMGYQWTVTDDLPFSCVYKSTPFNWIPEQNEVAIFLRSNFWSNRISFFSLDGQIFVKMLEEELMAWFENQDGYLIIWMDWETFGHHRPGYVENFLIPFLDSINGKVHLVFPSYLLTKYPKREVIVPPGTWSTSTDDFKYKNYWPLWHNPENKFHQLWWELARIILEIQTKAAGKIKDEKTLMVFDKALYSCQVWQYSMGNKSLAIQGMEYFKIIATLQEARQQKGKIDRIIGELEKLCQ